MVDDIMFDAIVDVVTPVLTGAAAPPVAPLLLAVEDDEAAQEADVGKVTPSLSREEVSPRQSRMPFPPIALKEYVRSAKLACKFNGRYTHSNVSCLRNPPSSPMG